MSRFYGSIQGNRGMATRMGHKSSGFTGHIRGWNVGVRIECHVDEDDDKDVLYVYRTGGSNGRTESKLIAIIKEGEEDGVIPKTRIKKPAESPFANIS